jgi:hypothetical protein
MIRDRSPRVTRLVWVAITALLVTFLVADPHGSPAHAVGTASISGNVTGQGTPKITLANTSVGAIAGDGTVVSATTDSNGNYTIAGLNAGSYTLKFTPPSTNNSHTTVPISVYVGQVWDHLTAVHTGDPVVVNAGQAVTGKDAVLARGATISGNVKAEGTPDTNFSDVQVTVLSETENSAAAVAFTDSSGNFTATGLDSGRYLLEFSNNFYYYETKKIAFSVLAGQVITGKDQILYQLAGTSSISGTVSVPTGTSLTEIEPILIRRDGFGGSSFVDANGNYKFSGYPAGEYTLEFFDYSQASFIAPQWWQNQSSLGTASFFTVSTGQAVSLSEVTMTIGASISGHVSIPTSPVSSGADISVRAYSASGEVAKGTQTNAAGDFTLSGLAVGAYRLHFYSVGTTTDVPPYLGCWWKNGTSLEDATLVSVGTGQEVTLADQVLPGITGGTGTISGTLTDSSGSPIHGSAGVYASIGTVDSYDNLIAKVNTGVGGTYSVSGLAVGTYKVGFTTDLIISGYMADALDPALGLVGSYPYLSRWAGTNSPTAYSQSYASAGTVTLASAGQTVSGINAVLENPTFEDVADPSYSFYPFIQWMASSGISTGTVQVSGKPLYNPANAVSRQAMASFLFKLSGETFVAPSVSTFADVDPSATFFKAIEWMASKGISTGTPQASGKPLFKPTDAVSRQAMALFLARYAHANLTVAPTVQSFADVPVDAPAAAAVKWMKDTGISTGTVQPSGLPLYKPVDPVSRQAMAAFLYRLAHLLV